MTSAQKCPVCQNAHGGTAILSDTLSDYKHIKCDLCGEFNASGTILATGLRTKGYKLSPVQIAALTHLIRQQNDNGKTDFKVTSVWLDENAEALKLPSHAQQVTNIIRHIGDMITANGDEITELPGHFSASVGSYNLRRCAKIVFQLKDNNILRAESGEYLSGILANGKLQSKLLHVDLTLKGWELYEKEKRGKFGGNYGFIAMKFDDEILDPFVNQVIKPLVKEKLKFDIVDLRDVSEAGVIDNIMRERIRDAAFVLVDLSHGNRGAYWEAGYAEGLGKPVLYLCEKSSFHNNDTKPHFDTNHCTTVMWSKDGDNTKFKNDLIATLRRSLNRFD
jgi:nucleoside 2-deoxyribosyltransferase